MEGPRGIEADIQSYTDDNRKFFFFLHFLFLNKHHQMLREAGGDQKTSIVGNSCIFH